MIYLYLKTHNKTGLKYLGKTISDPYKYKGSGTVWQRHIAKHGDDVTTQILFESECKEEFKAKALEISKQLNIVESKDFANLCYEEGQGGNTWCKKGITPKVDYEKRSHNQITKGHHRGWKISIDGIEYTSIRQASIHTGILLGTIKHRVLSKYWPNYCRI